jgi:hypothetical protein
MVSGTEYKRHLRRKESNYGVRSILSAMKHCRCNQLAIVGANSQHVRQAQIRLTNRAHRLQGQIGAEMKQAECGNQLKAIAMD